MPTKTPIDHELSNRVAGMTLHFLRRLSRKNEPG